MFHHDLNHTGYSTSTAPNTNNTVWSYTTGGNVYSSPAVDGGMVYVGSYDHMIYCLNASTGTQIWNYTTRDQVFSSPAVDGGMVYVGSRDHMIYCLNASTGVKIWNTTITDYLVESSPAVSSGMVFVGSADTRIYPYYRFHCLNASTGTQIWNYTTGNVGSSPAVSGGMVYFGTNVINPGDGRILCLNASTGTQIWSYTTGGNVFSSPALSGGMVYVGSYDHMIYCLNASTGTQIWNYTTGGSVNSCPAIAGGMVYVGSDDNRTYCLNASTGTQIWNYTTGGSVNSCPAIAGGMVYVGSDDNRTYCLNASTGTQIWSYTTGGFMESSPAVAGGIVFVGSGDHRVYAIGGVLTPTGTNVTIAFPAQNASVTFASVSSQGSTIFCAAEPPDSLFPSVVCNDITTTATYSGSIILQFGYSSSGLSLEDQQAMKIWLWNDSSACWVDVTTSINTTSHTVYGLSPHLSMFGVTSDVGLTGDLSVNGTTTLSIPPTPPAIPGGLAGLNYYQINTTKNLPLPINVSLAYSYQKEQPGAEIFNRMWVWSDTAGGWTDITTSVNTTSHTVYGTSAHVSMFGVTSLPQPPAGITITSANCPKTVVCQGYSTNISVTISNQGGTPQKNFDVSLYCNTTMLPTTYQIIQLDPGAQAILNFTWNTDAGWAIGNYCISAFSICVKWVQVARVGDISMDNKVDGRDLLILSRAFGSYGPDYYYPGSPATLGWNPNADITNDDKVDGRDLIIASRHFGEGI
jgi:outer membrane protein assembly factor BamB